jgi:hypothetical protein
MKGIYWYIFNEIEVKYPSPWNRMRTAIRRLPIHPIENLEYQPMGNPKELQGEEVWWRQQKPEPLPDTLMSP